MTKFLLKAVLYCIPLLTSCLADPKKAKGVEKLPIDSTNLAKDPHLIDAKSIYYQVAAVNNIDTTKEYYETLLNHIHDQPSFYEVKVGNDERVTNKLPLTYRPGSNLPSNIAGQGTSFPTNSNDNFSVHEFLNPSSTTAEAPASELNTYETESNFVADEPYIPALHGSKFTELLQIEDATHSDTPIVIKSQSVPSKKNKQNNSSTKGNTNSTRFATPANVEGCLKSKACILALAALVAATTTGALAIPLLGPGVGFFGRRKRSVDEIILTNANASSFIHHYSDFVHQKSRGTTLLEKEPFRSLAAYGYDFGGVNSLNEIDFIVHNFVALQRDLPTLPVEVLLKGGASETLKHHITSRSLRWKKAVLQDSENASLENDDSFETIALLEVQKDATSGGKQDADAAENTENIASRQQYDHSVLADSSSLPKEHRGIPESSSDGHSRIDPSVFLQLVSQTSNQYTQVSPVVASLKNSTQTSSMESNLSNYKQTISGPLGTSSLNKEHSSLQSSEHKSNYQQQLTALHGLPPFSNSYLPPDKSKAPYEANKQAVHSFPHFQNPDKANLQLLYNSIQKSSTPSTADPKYRNRQSLLALLPQKVYDEPPQSPSSTVDSNSILKALLLANLLQNPAISHLTQNDLNLLRGYLKTNTDQLAHKPSVGLRIQEPTTTSATDSDKYEGFGLSDPVFDFDLSVAFGVRNTTEVPDKGTGFQSAIGLVSPTIPETIHKPLVPTPQKVDINTGISSPNAFFPRPVRPPPFAFQRPPSLPQQNVAASLVQQLNTAAGVGLHDGTSVVHQSFYQPLASESRNFYQLLCAAILEPNIPLNQITAYIAERCLVMRYLRMI